MNRFATYEEENIHYWTHRAPGYSGVNQEELATDQKRVWGRTIQERIAARFPGRKPGLHPGAGRGHRPRAFSPSFWREWAIR